MFETWIETEVTKLPTVMRLMGRAFSLDDGANKVGVILKENGQPKAVTGAIEGYVIKPDGSMLRRISGSKENNRAWIVLPASAYTMQGQITVTVKAVNDTEVSTLGVLEAYVYPSGQTQ